MRTQATRLKSKKPLCRDYKRFNEKTFLFELESENLTRNSISSNENYVYLSHQFAGVVNKHAPLKAKVLRGNNAPSIDKHLRKEIYQRSALRNNLTENQTSSTGKSIRNSEINV